MLSYCLIYIKKKTESKTPKVVRTKNRNIMLLLKCAVCNSKKSAISKEQEAKEFLGNLLGAKIPISEDILVVNILFQIYKMKAIVNKILLAGDKFMAKLNLRQPKIM